MPGDSCNRDEQCTFIKQITRDSFLFEYQCINRKCKYVPLGGPCAYLVGFLNSQCIRGTICSKSNTCAAIVCT